MIVTIDTIKVISVFVPKNPFTPISKSCYLLHNGLRTGELSLTLSSSHSIFWQRDWEYLQYIPYDFEMKVAGIISTCSEYFLQHEKKSFSISDLLYGSEPLLTLAQYMEGQLLSKFIFACFLLQILNIKQAKTQKYFKWQNKNKHIWYNLSYFGIFETTFCNCELDIGSHHQQALISDSRSKHLTSNVFAVCSVLSCKCILVDFQNIIHLRPLYSRQNHSP